MLTCNLRWLRRRKSCWTVTEMRSRISIHLLAAFAVRCWISSPISPSLLNPISSNLHDRNSEQCPWLIPWSWMRGLSLRQLETHSHCFIFFSDFHSSDSAKHNGDRNLSLLGRKTHPNSTYLLNIVQLFSSQYLVNVLPFPSPEKSLSLFWSSLLSLFTMKSRKESGITYWPRHLVLLSDL